jgi:anthranilate synthase component 1
MKTTTYILNSLKLPGDRFTPINLYLKIRDAFPYSVLLESSDYRANDNAYSFIGFNQLANIKASQNSVFVKHYNQSYNFEVNNKEEIIFRLKEFKDSFKIENLEDSFINGLFGAFFHDVVDVFEDLNLKNKQNKEVFNFSFYKYLLIFNHFTNELILQYYTELNEKLNINEILEIIHGFDKQSFPFKRTTAEISDCSDEDYLTMINKTKEYLQGGEIFQAVISRKFRTSFKGDEFNVYRALRMINPSPYLFFFDFGNYKLFGSSPEAQLKVKNKTASIFPIAGTYKRTGNDIIDQIEIEKLKKDEKENAEHSMLVDLARNDLSRNCKDVKVVKYKEVQIFSHVIHLVSEVNGIMKPYTDSLDILAGSFPAGTLSGAPKIRALQIIDELERSDRNFYGGCVGYIGFNNDLNLAITIRSFKSENNHLTYRAGAGVVINSVPQNELNEINNKIAALRKAVLFAETI